MSSPSSTECVASLEPLARERGLGIESVVGGPLPRVRAERSALRRAVSNLLQNAILHGGDGGPWGCARRRRARWASRRCASRSRTGAAASAAEVPHLFEPFFRGAEAVSSQTRGSGLGLSLVKRIADAHGGAVEVTTAPGRGSAFTLVLPAVARSHDDPPHTAG